MKLSERAMLTNLHIGSWSGKAIDRDVTEDVGVRHNADPKASGAYSKRLISAKALHDVQSKISVARVTHRTLTLPWDDANRILAATNFKHYTEQMRLHRLGVEAAAQKLADSFPEHIKEAETRLGTMFDRSEYPDPAEVKASFTMDVEIGPVPEAGDFRTKLSEATVKAITKDIEQRSEQRVKRAVADIFERVVDVTTKMAERLRAYESKEGADGTFRDTLVWNVTELAQLIPSLNITGDPKLDSLAKELLEQCGTTSPTLLRSDAKLRKQTATAAEKLARKAKAMLG